MESNSDSLSSGERNGNSLNQHGVIARWRCHVGVVGPTRRYTGTVKELQSQVLAEAGWKSGPQKVTAL